MANESVRAAIALRGVSHRYGRKVVLDQLDLTVPEGAMYVLLGANGAGKTTLLRLLIGVERARAGSVEIFGTPVSKLTLAQRQQIAYVAEGQQLPDWMREEQLEAYCAPLYPTWDTALAASLRERFDLDPKQKLGKMSRGQRMKAALLCALAPRPKVLLMDEPFTGMDVAVKDELVRGLLDVAGDEGWSVLMSTHDIAEVDTVVDYAGFLKGAKLQLEGPVEQLREMYRRVEFTLNGAASDVRVPDSWKQVERAGQRLMAVVPASERLTPDLFAGAVLEQPARPLTLKELYLAVQAGA
ncbi:MAG: ABC transporter ATP-binding protein [Gemmatimonadaceae bacterium]|nr:ABC transporter ATP-binding protein [Gemmatimonadaceae bacterium]